MRGIILLNGEPYAEKIDDCGALVYCCDGAYRWAKGKLRIDKNLGDFDSLDEVPYPLPDEVYPAEKNFTDGEIAMEKLLEKGVTEIEIYGGGGGREDHFLGNLQLVYKAFARGVNCSLITENSRIFAGTGSVFLGNYNKKTISVLPFGGTVHIMGSKGLKYEYPATLSYGECRGISNVVESESACLTVKGTALFIINLGEV